MILVPSAGTASAAPVNASVNVSSRQRSGSLMAMMIVFICDRCLMVKKRPGPIKIGSGPRNALQAGSAAGLVGVARHFAVEQTLHRREEQVVALALVTIFWVRRLNLADNFR